jgi:hypothetical protein
VKRYDGRLHGLLPPPLGSLEEKLARDRRGRGRQAVRDGEAQVASETELLRAIDADFPEPVCEAYERAS